jgi:hypothetical protein
VTTEQVNHPEHKIAGAPISWGVSEVPGWGFQLGPDRVLREMCEVGLLATEIGPEGFLPSEPAAMVIGGTDPAELARQAPKRIAHLHLKDVDSTIAARVQSGQLSYSEAVRMECTGRSVTVMWTSPPSSDTYGHMATSAGTPSNRTRFSPQNPKTKGLSRTYGSVPNICGQSSLNPHTRCDSYSREDHLCAGEPSDHCDTVNHETRSPWSTSASMCAKTAVVRVWLPMKSGGRPIESRLARR